MSDLLKSYNATIDGGEAGKTTITAVNAAEALVLAIAWAREGDWPREGCDIEVSVVNVDDPDDSAEDTIHILSEDERRNARLDADGEIIGRKRREYDSDEVIRINDDYYFRHVNGGYRGAWDHRTHPDVFECLIVSLPEARRRLLGMGMDPGLVAARAAA